MHLILPGFKNPNMKKLFFIVFLIIFSIAMGMGQKPNVTIVGHILGYNGKSKVYYSISPYPNSFNSEFVYPDSTGQFVINKFITATHFFGMYYSQDGTDHSCRLILRPNNYYKFNSAGYQPDEINQDTYYSPEIFKLNYRVEGGSYFKTDVGQMYFNLIDNGVKYSSYLDEWDLNHPALLIDTLQARIKKQETIFARMLAKQEIDSGFYILAKLNIDYYNAFKLAETIYATWQRKEFAITDSSLRNELYKVYPKIFELYPVKGVDMKWLWAFERYVDLYLCFREDFINGEFNPKERKGPLMIKTMQSSNDVLSGEAYQYYKKAKGLSYVYSLDLQASQKGKELLEGDSEFRNSPAGQLLENYLIPRAEEFEKLSMEKFPAGVKILDKNNQINSFKQLLDSLNGRPALIDCWATWCAPCIGQFASIKDLKSFLDKNGIQMIYIGYELDENREKWENYIKKYDLTGYHFIANDQFKEQLKMLFGGYIALPTYMIVDSDGNILLKNAAFPSEGKKLYDQLKDLLKL